MGLDPTSATAAGHTSAKRLTQYIAAIAATIGALAGGAVLGWSNPAQEKIVNVTSAYSFEVSEEDYSWVGSLSNIGGIISCLMIGFMMDFVGRKNTMLLLIIPFTAGWLLIIWPWAVMSLFIGRFLTGFAGGAFFVVAPSYIGEIATKDIRGTLGSYLQLMVTIGILFAYVIGYFVELKWFSIICAILPLVFGAVFVWIPESPYFYVKKNNTEQAEASLKWLRGEDYDYSDELREIQAENDLVVRNQVEFFEALSKPATKRGLLITIGLVFFVQLAGINAVIFYSASIFDAAKTGIKGSLATIVVGIMQVVATFVCQMTIDRLGRRILLVTSAVIMTICNVALGIYFHFNLTSMGWLPVASICLYIVAFSLGAGPIPWVLIGELYAIEAKALASSLTGSSSWLLSFFVTKYFGNVKGAIGAGPTFWIFAGFAGAMCLFVFALMPETKGKSFNEIQQSLGARSGRDESYADDRTTATNASQNTINI